jgi:hypothetical protein
VEGEDGEDSGVKRGCEMDFSIGGVPAMNRFLQNTKFISQKTFVSKRCMIEMYHTTKTVSSSITIVTESYDLFG